MQILFTDLDDTLLDNKSQVSPGTKAFLEEFLAAGNRLVLSSGRPFLSVLQVKERAGISGPGIFLSCSNGCRIFDCDAGRTIRKQTLPLPWVAHLEQAANALSLHIQTYREEIGKEAIVTPKEDEMTAYYRKKIHLPLVISENLCDALTEEPCKMLAISLHNPEKLEVFRRAIASWAEGKVRTIYSNARYLELFHWDGGKGSALHFLCDYLGVTPGDCFAAGDAENDISMLEAAGCGIAMKNAPDKVKAHADIVTDFDNNQDGLAYTMRNLLQM